MIETYVYSVTQIYFPMLLAAAIGFFVFSAIAPFIGADNNHPRPNGAMTIMTFFVAVWPLMIPAIIASVFFFSIYMFSAIAYVLAKKSPQARALKRRLYKQT